MIDHSLAALLFIRACVILLQYAPLIEVSLFLPCLFLMFNPTNPIAQIISYRTLQITTYTFASLLIVEAIYYFTYYRPHKRRLQQWADYPAPLSLSERRHLFERCVANVSDWNNYLRLWFMLLCTVILGSGASTILNVYLPLISSIPQQNQQSQPSKPAIFGKNTLHRHIQVGNNYLMIAHIVQWLDI